MAETTADVRRDIELTRERMSTTLQELEQRLNLMQVVRDHPWPALAVAMGAGLALSGTGADVKAAQATTDVTRSARGRVGLALDGLVADLLGGVRGAIEERVDSLIGDVRYAVLGGDGTRAATSDLVLTQHTGPAGATDGAVAPRAD